MILFAGCWLSLISDEFGCARGDPGWEPRGTDPLHGLAGFVFGVSSLFLLGAALSRRWCMVAAELTFTGWFAVYLSSHPNDPNWCRAS